MNGTQVVEFKMSDAYHCFQCLSTVYPFSRLLRHSVTMVDVFLCLINRDLLLLQSLFVFNIYTLAVAITIISSVRRAITNVQRLTEYSRLYISNNFLSILAVPNKAVLCITPTLHVMPSFPIHLSNSAETLSRAPITTGTISTFLNFNNLLISFFRSWYFSTFSFFFSLYSYWYSNINNYPLLFLLGNNSSFFDQFSILSC